MVFKYLNEMSSSELRTEFERMCSQEVFTESRAIVRLTMYLLGIGKNPFTFKFDIKNQVGGEEERWEDVVVDDIEAGKVANLEPSVSAGVTVTKVLNVPANLLLMPICLIRIFLLSN